jgi:putative transposase
MPQKIRLQSPGSFALIEAHSVEGKALFIDENDRSEFLSRFKKVIEKTGYECYAWCLLDTEYSLLVRTNQKLLDKLMRPVNSGYARWYNKKYNRHGYLFQDRFDSILYQDSDRIPEAIRHIHLAPVRADKVTSLHDLVKWRWCSHAFILDNDALGVEFQNRAKILHYFAIDESLAIEKYMKWLGEGINTQRISEAGNFNYPESVEIAGSKKGWPAVIGDIEFVKESMMRHSAMRDYRLHRQADYPLILQNIAQTVLRKYSLEMIDLITDKRRFINTAARKIFCTIAYSEELIPMAVIARFLKVTISAVSKLFDRKSVCFSYLH